MLNMHGAEEREIGREICPGEWAGDNQWEKQQGFGIFQEKLNKAQEIELPSLLGVLGADMGEHLLVPAFHQYSFYLSHFQHLPFYILPPSILWI